MATHTYNIIIVYRSSHALLPGSKYSQTLLFMDTEGAIENVCIKGVSVLRGFFSPETSQTVSNDQVSVLSGCP